MTDLDAAMRFAAISADRSRVHVPAHSRHGEPRLACVHMERQKGKLVCRCECFHPLGSGDSEPCESRKGSSLCYHVRAAVMTLAQSAGQRLYFFSSVKAAMDKKGDNGTFLNVCTPEGVSVPCISFAVKARAVQSVKPITIKPVPVSDPSVPEWGKDANGELVF